MWVLAEHVFASTVALMVKQQRRFGLGTEFDGPACWYLPDKNDELTESPIQRVLDRWLRVAGFRTAYGVSKEMKSVPLRRKADRWRKGDVVPALPSLWHLVGKYAAQISWLDSAEAWKARFTLACAAQNAFDQADDYFKFINENPAEKLAEICRANMKQEFLEDDDGILIQNNIFFSVRLIERRLRAEGKFDDLFAKMPPASLKMTWGPEVSDDAINKWRQRCEWESKRGNWFAHYLRNEAQKAGRIGKAPSLDDSYQLKEFIFNLGVLELNRLISEHRK